MQKIRQNQRFGDDLVLREWFGGMELLETRFRSRKPRRMDDYELRRAFNYIRIYEEAKVRSESNGGPLVISPKVSEKATEKYSEIAACHFRLVVKMVHAKLAVRHIVAVELPGEVRADLYQTGMNALMDSARETSITEAKTIPVEVLGKAFRTYVAYNVSWSLDRALIGMATVHLPRGYKRTDAIAEAAIAYVESNGRKIVFGKVEKTAEKFGLRGKTNLKDLVRKIAILGNLDEERKELERIRLAIQEGWAQPASLDYPKDAGNGARLSEAPLSEAIMGVDGREVVFRSLALQKVRAPIADAIGRLPERLRELVEAKFLRLNAPKDEELGAGEKTRAAVNFDLNTAYRLLKKKPEISDAADVLGINRSEDRKGKHALSRKKEVLAGFKAPMDKFWPTVRDSPIGPERLKKNLQMLKDAGALDFGLLYPGHLIVRDGAHLSQTIRTVKKLRAEREKHN